MRNTDFSRGIPFTQFIKPNGKAVPQWIQRSNEVTQKARRIINAGYEFHVEELRTGEISLTITDEHADHGIELATNGPGMGEAVDRLINSFDKLPDDQESEEAA